MPVNSLVLKLVLERVLVTQRALLNACACLFQRKDDMILWKCAENSIPHSVTCQNVDRALAYALVPFEPSPVMFPFHL